MSLRDTEYYQFLQSLKDRGLNASRLQDFEYTKSPTSFCVKEGARSNQRICMMRHDIDHEVSYAHRMAEIESEAGMSATYYVLTSDTAKWWADPKRRREGLTLLQDMQDMGHEIGLHYDVLGDYFSSSADKVGSHIDESLKTLRGAGLNVVGCCAHGSGRMAAALGCNTQNRPEKKWNQTWVWKNFGVAPYTLRLNDRELSMPCLDLKDYNLQYEAYKVKKDWYYTDVHPKPYSGGKYTHAMKSIPSRCRTDVEAVYKDKEMTDIPPGIIRKGEVLQVSLHPIKWKESL